MLYTEIFNFPVDTIGKYTAEGATYLSKTKQLLIPGVYVPGMKEHEFRRGLSLVFKNGAYGVSVFDLAAMTPQYWKILREEFQKQK